METKDPQSISRLSAEGRGRRSATGMTSDTILDAGNESTSDSNFTYTVEYNENFDDSLSFDADGTGSIYSYGCDGKTTRRRSHSQTVRGTETFVDRSIYDEVDANMLAELTQSNKMLEETKRENSQLMDEINRLRDEFVMLESEKGSTLRRKTQTGDIKLFGVQNVLMPNANNTPVFATGVSGKVFGKHGAGTMQNYQDNTTLTSGAHESDLSSSSLSQAKAHFFIGNSKLPHDHGYENNSYSYLFPYSKRRNQKEQILVQVRHRRYSLARERKFNRMSEKAGGPKFLGFESEMALESRIEPELKNVERAPVRPPLKKTDSEMLRNRKWLGDAVLVDPSRGSVIHLPRGGVYVHTKKGAVQFGIPPETIKDSLKLGLGVPTIYVVPKERFNIKLGINMCEVEFPAYFNYFLQNLSIHLVVTPEVEGIVRAVVDETLEGPKKEHLYVDEEYPETTPESGRFAYSARPDHEKEINFFKEPRNGNEISTDKLVKFIYFLPKKCGTSNNKVSKEHVENCNICNNKVCDKCHRRRSNSNNSNKSCGSCGSSHSLKQSQSSLETRDVTGQCDATDSSSSRRSSGHSQNRTSTGVVEDIESEEAAFANETGDYRRSVAGEALEEGLEDPVLEADLGNGLVVVDLGSEYVVYDDGHEVARVPSFLCAWAPSTNPSKKNIVPKTVVDPPEFGITVLGSSHGFDKAGSTSGFVLWIHKTGIMVDPPPHATDILMRSGISPRMISGVILTHCHADHDAGTFQKILKEGRITLITTKTILDSLIRKYSIISGFAEEFLLRLFEQRVVKIGEKVHWGSGTLRFFYSLHALPCIGFEAHVGGKSFVYSADTFYDPQGLKRLMDDGYLTPSRYNGLLDFPFHYDICIHEAGIPPIHTPFSVLQQLPEEVKQNLYIIHISKDRAKEAGLRHAEVGVENTIVIPVKKSSHNEAAAILKLLLSSDIFRHLTMAQASDLLQLTDNASYKADEYICKEGTEGKEMYLILTGFVGVDLVHDVTDTNSDAGDENVGDTKLGYARRVFGSGDYLGEISLLDNVPRTSSIIALTDVTLLKLDQHAFQYVMDMTPGLINRLEKLSRIRRNPSWKAIDSNSVFSRLGSSQKAQLQAILQSCTVRAGEVLWRHNKPALAAYLIASGELEFVEIREELGTPFRKGAFLCNIISMLSHLTGDRLDSLDIDSRPNSETDFMRSTMNSERSKVNMEVASHVNKILDSHERRYTGFIENTRSSFPMGTDDIKHRSRGSFSVGDHKQLLSSFVTDTNNNTAELSQGRESNLSGSGRSSIKGTVTSGVTLVAKTDCVLFFVEPEDMIECLEQNPGIFINLIDSLVLE